jgi:hypothetical protein
MTDTIVRIGLTATRHGLSQPQKEALRSVLAGNAGTFHHGLCVGGDADGHAIARELGYRIVGHPPSDPKLRADLVCDEFRPEKPYLTRNKDIVNETSVLVACPAELEEQQRGGTWSTYRFARKLRRPTILILPDGRLVRNDGVER